VLRALSLFTTILNSPMHWWRIGKDVRGSRSGKGAHGAGIGQNVGFLSRAAVYGLSASGIVTGTCGDGGRQTFRVVFTGCRNTRLRARNR